MKLHSRHFDRIRVKPGEERTPAEAPRCDRPGCTAAGEYRAPKGRGREGQYFRFCLDHVKEYNAGYNYFAGLPDEEVASFQKSAVTGHRPTWAMGVNAWRKGNDGAQRTNAWAEHETGPRVVDPFEMFAGAGFGPRTQAKPERPRVLGPALQAFTTLDLDPGAAPEEIKARYKALVKRYHPDVHGGDRAMETRFREVVQAYAVLKAGGYLG